MTLEQILGVLEGLASTVASTGGPTGLLGAAGPNVQAGAAIADYVLKIAQASVRAHEGVTGKALDMSQLHQIELVK